VYGKNYFGSILISVRASQTEPKSNYFKINQRHTKARSTPSSLLTTSIPKPVVYIASPNTININSTWPQTRNSTDGCIWEGCVLAGIARIEKEVSQAEDLEDRTSSMRYLWRVFKTLIESSDFGSEDTVNNFFQHCFISDPDVARDITTLHNKHVDDLKL
jgi:hypothetical protein